MIPSRNFPSKRRSRRAQRRGVAIVIVLGLISFAMALSYAMLRTQITAVAIQNNSSRDSDARQAAIAGITIALQKMTEANWAGVGVPLTGKISPNVTYEVAYTTGDASLDANDAGYMEYPYRVTLLSTGYAADPGNPSHRATHRVQAVVQLIRRKLADPPTGWDALQSYTVYQWGNSNVDVELPVRVEGSVYLNGALRLCQHYPHDMKPFHGVIDEVAIYDQDLWESDIGHIYDSIVGLDDHYASVEEAFLDKDPIAWWRLGEVAGTTVVVDQTGNYHGTYVGAAAGAAGAPILGGSTGTQFDGHDDYIDVGTMDVPGNEMTILAWFKPDSFGYGDGRIVSKATGSGEQDHYWMLSTFMNGADHVLRFRLRANGSTKTLIAPLGALTAGQWVFAAAVYDGSKMRLYKNGIQVAETSKDGNINTNSLVPVYIGDNPPGSSRTRYLKDLETLREIGTGDFRPFSGPLLLPYSNTPSDSLELVQEVLNLTTSDVSPSYTPPVSVPTGVLTYRLYPGGKEYTIEQLDGWLSNVAKGPDPHTNPLGVFGVQGVVHLGNNVTINGSLIAERVDKGPEVSFEGPNVHLLAVDLPALHGNSPSAKIQLPVAMVIDDARIDEFATGSIHGLVLTGRKFELRSGDGSVNFDVVGKLLTRDLKLKERTNWNLGSNWWTARLNEFMMFLRQNGNSSSLPGFPYWTQQYGLLYDPVLTIQPDPNAVQYHWPDWSQPIFVPHPNDGGLRWDLLDWKDGV